MSALPRSLFSCPVIGHISHKPHETLFTPIFLFVRIGNKPV